MREVLRDVYRATMAEALSEAGVSWKVYNDLTTLLELGPSLHFKTFWNPTTPSQAAIASTVFIIVYDERRLL